MKKTIYLLVCSLVTVCLYGQDYYMYVGGKKHYYNASSTKVFIRLEDSANVDSMKTAIRTAFPSQNVKTEDIDAKSMLVDRKNVSKAQSIDLAKQWNRKEHIRYATPVLLDENGTEVGGITNQIFVRLKQIEDYPVLLNSVQPYNITQIVSCEFDNRTYLMKIDNFAQKDALQIANELHETGLFEYAEPNLMQILQLSTNDQYYPQQWGLNNTGQNGGTSGVDIKANQAWSITTGSPNIRIAVLDIGVELNHPDLVNALLPGFDATGNESNGAPINNTGDDAHGTACSGIIAAQGNNTIGITGIAYDCRILPVRIATRSTGWTTTESQYIASGLNWAVQNNARIISMSFGCVETTILNTAIDNAVDNGCVLIAASGNNNASSVSYPASNQNVIAVGAINRNGQRASFSNYGTMLDVVAPGVDIYTTDIQGSAGYNTASNTSGNYYSGFGGTSAACPHVSGVAALILSVRPDLTQAQVRQAIESTCTKLSGYSFSNNSSHPNGTWNSQAGHGLVNAYAAVNSVMLTISGPSFFQSTGTFTIQNLPATGAVSLQTSSGLSASISGNTITLNSNYPGEGWLQVSVATAFGTFTSNTLQFIHGEYVPQVEIFGGVACTNNGCYMDCGVETNKWTTNISYSTINGFQFYFSSDTYKSLASGFTYQARIKKQSTGAVVYTLPGTFNTACPVSVEYTGLEDNTWYHLELRLMTDNPNSSWKNAGEVCAITRPGIFSLSLDAFTLYPNPSNGIFTLASVSPALLQSPNQAPAQSVQSTSGSQPEPLVVSIYSSLTGVLAKELSIGFSGEYTINAGDLPAGYYLVKVSRNSDVVYSKQIRIQ